MPLSHIDNALKDLIKASDESELIDIIIARPSLANNPEVLDLIKLRKEALSNFNMDNDNIQFPRLISEILDNISINGDEYIELKSSMDLNDVEINALFNKAGRKWENIKANICSQFAQGASS